MAGYVSRSIETSDGLRLYARDYGSQEPGAPVVLCLPGLARTSADFDPLALHLVASDPERRVLAIDYRGRGLSDRDPNPENYDLPVECDDILAVTDALGIDAAVLIGTSRGGLHTMMLAAVRPSLLRGALLNDIGPVIEADGLLRIRSYIGKLPQPSSWDEAVKLLRTIAGGQFTGLSEADWLAYAETTFEVRDGVFLPRYDPALMHNLSKLDLNAVPTLWPQFMALKAVPVLVVRGENSDLLSVETATEMTRQHPDCVLVTVPGQGHAPLLNDSATMAAIDQFVARCTGDAAGAARAQSGLSLLS